MRDLVNNLSVVQVIDPNTAHTTDIEGDSVDLVEHKAILFFLKALEITDGTFTPKLQESDDDLSWSDVVSGNVVGSFHSASTADTASSLVVQDLTYTAKEPGPDGDAITIAYTTGATAGAEVVSRTGTAISVQIDDGNSTATQVKAAIEANFGANELVSVAISGTGATAQVAASAAPLAGGARSEDQSEVGYIGGKRYVRMFVGVTGSPSTGGKFYCVAVKGKPNLSPI